MPRRIAVAVMLLVSLLSLPARLSGQATNATITGFVTDPTKAVIAGVKVDVINMDTNIRYTATTNQEGSYTVPSLPPGNYKVEVEKPGFKTVIKPDLVLHVEDAIEINFAMEVGSVSESVTVNATATNQSPAVSMTVTQDFVENMPLNGRSIQDLEALAPGATSSANDNGLYSTNGQRDDANYFTVDGISANTGPGTSLGGAYFIGSQGAFAGMSGVYPAQTALGTTQSLVSVDALQEFTVQTSGYSAENGRQPGAQVALTTRSGTNDLHGSIFDYFRNTALDANSYANNFLAVPREPERQNDFGGTFGGPITIPHVYNGKDKTFFFFSYEGLLLVLPGSSINTVPDATFRASGGAALQPFLNAFPLPNGPPVGNGTEGNFFTASYGNPNNLENLSVRVDHTLNEKIQMFGRYFRTTSSADSNNGVGEYDLTKDNSSGVTAGATVKISPGIINELRFNYTQDQGVHQSYPKAFFGSTTYPESLLIPPQYVGSVGTNAFVDFSFSTADGNFASFFVPQYLYAFQSQHSMNVVDTLSWTPLRHNLSFGADLRRLSPTYFPSARSTGAFVESVSDYEQANASFLALGNGTGAKPVFDAFSLYVNDAWRIASRFTLTYGLRWEFNPVPGPYQGKYPVAANQITNFATLQLAPAGTPPYQTRYDNFAPRLGLAWQIFPSFNHPLVLRAGAGIYYDLGQNLAAAGYGGFPFSNVTIVNEVPLPASATDLAPPPPNSPLVPPYGHINALSDPHLVLPYTEQWNLAVDYGLTSKNTFTASYVGNAGKKLLYPYQVTPTTNPDFPNGFVVVANAASSSYQALQLQDHGEIVRGMNVIASYTWAHAEDNGSTEIGFSANTLGEFGGDNLGPQWGNSDNDIAQVFNVALNYEIPDRTTSRMMTALTKGWLVATRFSAQSGNPFSVVQSINGLPGTNIQVGTFADLIPGVPVYLHAVSGVPRGWELNPAAFAAVPVDPTTGLPERQGTSFRNEFHGPAFWGLNFSVQRAFPIYERLNLVFRVDAFNVLNHANLGQVNSLFFPGNTAFGQLSQSGVTTIGSANPLYAMGAARSLQLSLKLNF